MHSDDIDTTFAAMTAGLDLDINCDTDPAPDAPFAVSASGSILVNLDFPMRVILGNAAERLFEALGAEAAAALPTPVVEEPEDGDDFAERAQLTLTGVRVVRLERLTTTLMEAEISPEDAHAWIGAANDIRLQTRSELSTLLTVGSPSAEDVALLALTGDLAGAVSHLLIEALRG